jgi:hypothetical protein
MKLTDILLEALPLSTAKKYRRVWNPDTYKSLFMSYPVDMRTQNGYRLYFPLEMSNSKPVVAPKDIQTSLASKGYEVSDYVGGMAKEINGRRVMKIGKLLNTDPSLLNKFANDPKRATKKSGPLMVCISRHPYDVAGMSTDRGWTSCMDLKTGELKRKVKLDVVHGSMIAYLIRADDKNIKNPLARIIIKPFLSKDGKETVFQTAGVYGTGNRAFTKFVDGWVNELNKDKVGAYNMRPTMYSDGGSHNVVVNPRKIPFDKLVSMIRKDEILAHNLPYVYKSVTNPPDDFTAMCLQRNVEVLRYVNSNNPSYSEFVSTTLNHDGSAIRWVKNPTDEQKMQSIKQWPQAIKFIKNPTEEMMAAAVRRTGSCIKYIKNPSENLQMMAVRKNAYNIIDIAGNINPAEAVQLYVVKKDGGMIVYIPNPPEAVQIAALNHGGRLRNIKKPSEKVILHALSKHGDQIQSVKNPTEEMKEVAIKQDPKNVLHIPVLSQSLQQLALKLGGWEMATRYMHKPSTETLIQCLHQNLKSFNHMFDPSKKIVAYYEKLKAERDARIDAQEKSRRK